MTSISSKEYREGKNAVGRMPAAFVRITISEMPPSANSLRKSFIRGDKVFSAKSDKYAAWREAALWEIANQKVGRIQGPYSLSIAVQRHWRSKRARDIDNVIKPISDTLVKAGIIDDDFLAESIFAKWADNLDGNAVVVIVQQAEEAFAA